MTDEQLDLFNNATFRTTLRQEQLLMDADALRQWKAQIFNYQKQVRESQPPQQTRLFDLIPTHCDPDSIDPFSLRLNTMQFWRMPADSPGYPCIYFVIDNTLPIVLYVGESCQSNQRWKGVHDCKRYVEKYHDLHSKHGLNRAVSIAFWFDTPANRTARLNLELSLIKRWRSPFNKENWQMWGQPFG
ncbi:GIY-YIG nuclease family protein [Microcoleus sp. FACHB-SPT15]|nr:GIY-YIG nuclease family protein [Microcoleus sp. FACHB-SPT15]